MTSFIIEHGSALNAWGQIQRDLRHRIDHGEFAAGARIATEVELSEYYGVSRVTVRRSIRALIEDGYLRAQQGSGTYVTDRTKSLVCELDLARPWKEQLLIDGHRAQSQLIDTESTSPLPIEVAAAFGKHGPTSGLTFARTIHTVDDIAIGVTESWRTDPWVLLAHSVDRELRPEPMVAECFAEIGFATALQAGLLQTYLDIPLIVVVARSHFAATGTIAEYARTSWLASRVRLAYTRHLSSAEIDVANPDAAPVGRDRSPAPATQPVSATASPG